MPHDQLLQGKPRARVLHAHGQGEEAAPHADALAIGEGVQLWARILRDVEAGALQPVYRGSYLRPYRQEPAPRLPGFCLG